MSHTPPVGSKGAAIKKILYEIILDAEKNKELGEQNLFMQITPEVLDKAAQSIVAILAQEVKRARIDELEGFLERTVHRDKQPGDLDKDGNRMQMKVRTSYNYAKAEMRHDIKDRLERLG